MELQLATLTALFWETVWGQNGSSSAILWDAHFHSDSPELFLKTDDCYLHPNSPGHPLEETGLEELKN